MTRKMNAAAIEDLFQVFSKDNPNPQTELIYHNTYTLLVAVVLSAQATDKGVNKATPALFAKVKTPQALLDLGEAGLKDCIKTIGLYNTKAKNLMKLSQILVDEHQGEVPHDRASLESLPGVGRKTANVILNTAFGDPTIAVDTHIFRVSNRLGLSPGKTPLEVEKGLMKRIPKAYLLDAHHWLVLHGRYVCTARRPKCPECLVRHVCLYPQKTLAVGGVI